MYLVDQKGSDQQIVLQRDKNRASEHEMQSLRQLTPRRLRSSGNIGGVAEFSVRHQWEFEGADNVPIHTIILINFGTLIGEFGAADVIRDLLIFHSLSFPCERAEKKNENNERE